MLMGMGSALRGSLVMGPVWVGVMLKDTAGLTDACILRPRNGDAASQNGPRNNIDDQNQSQEHQPRSPSLPVPILVRRQSIPENHLRQRGRRLIPAGTPESAS